MKKRWLIQFKFAIPSFLYYAARMKQPQSANLVIKYVLTIFLIFSGATADEPERLISGINTSINQHPYAASIRTDGLHQCNGAIISRSHILTAGHCIAPWKKEWKGMEITVLTGTNDLSQGGVVSAVADGFHHEQYWEDPSTNTMYYDIGVIKLATPLQFTKFQNPIRVTTSDISAGEQVKIVGWGDTDYPDGNVSNILQELSVTTVNEATCRIYSPRLYEEEPNKDFCTILKRGAGTCSGDSGSPVVRKNEIVGVVSHGIPCALGFPDIHANVYQLRSFVFEALQR